MELNSHYQGQGSVYPLLSNSKEKCNSHEFVTTSTHSIMTTQYHVYVTIKSISGTNHLENQDKKHTLSYSSKHLEHSFNPKVR